MLRKAHIWPIVWLLLSLVAVLHVFCLSAAIVGRVAYPYDLEWMEGGLLVHALRLANGQAIYAEPSVEFIPYLYTPLYPALLAALKPLVGISYVVGRCVSVLALLGTMGLVARTIFRAVEPDKSLQQRSRLIAAVMVAWGFLAATYPWVEGWFDLVRADTLLLFLVMLGVSLTVHFVNMPGRKGLFGLGWAASILALSFFCKQTGFLFAGGAGLIVLASNWRRSFLFAGILAVIGLGGTALLNWQSDGWFWTYAFKVHQAHEFSKERFWQALGHMFGHFPVMTSLIGLGLISILVAQFRGSWSKVHRAFLAWLAPYSVALLAGALGFGTQWAHYNAYMPAMFLGGLLCGLALLSVWQTLSEMPYPVKNIGYFVGLAAVCIQLWSARWSPKPFVPTAKDRAAGQKLIAKIAAEPGEVWVPFHPWYAHLAGKKPYVHRIGVMDVSFRGKWKVKGLNQALTERFFSAIFFDNRPIGWEFPTLSRTYRRAESIPKDAQLRLTSGAKVIPDAIWRPQ